MAEALLRLDKVSKRFGNGVIGIDGVSLDIARGEFVSLLGPSGCGKTTTLRVIAGFETPTEGSVLLENRDITSLRPFDRPVNTVFQDYALFPHLDVFDNVAFGLSLKRMPGSEQKKRVAEGLDLVGLSDKTRARISELSGGQRQRVALARALVCEPKLLLLDEPLSALDAHLREQMQIELKRLQSRLGMTFVLVTHDQTEALSISDRIAVMNGGRMEQVASPAELYDRPATRFVASFIGTMNLLSASRLDGSFAVLDFPVAVHEGAGTPASLQIGLRPEDVIIAPPSEGGTPFRVASVVFHGRSLRIHGETAAGLPLVIDTPRDEHGRRPNPGDVLGVRQRPGTTCPVLD